MGLVDKLGGLMAAIREAKRLAGFQEGQDVRISLTQPDFSLSEAITGLVLSPQGVKESLQAWLLAMDAWDETALALMPTVYEVNR